MRSTPTSAGWRRSATTPGSRRSAFPPPLREVLVESVPRTEVVDAADADRLWQARRGLFFKPVAGYGSRAAYRGDKLTRRVWQEIVDGEYVAQALVAPGERRVATDDGSTVLKFDLRAYAYDGAVQWLAARLYQGQTTNFRTPGGGFAPVYGLPAAASATACACDAAGVDGEADAESRSHAADSATNAPGGAG